MVNYYEFSNRYKLQLFGMNIIKLSCFKSISVKLKLCVHVE